MFQCTCGLLWVKGRKRDQLGKPFRFDELGGREERSHVTGGECIGGDEMMRDLGVQCAYDMNA